MPQCPILQGSSHCVCFLHKVPPVDPGPLPPILFQFPVRIDCFRAGDKSSQIKIEDACRATRSFGDVSGGSVSGEVELRFEYDGKRDEC
jgi:hypothetical protein